MNQVIEQLLERKSTRVFSKEPVSEKMKAQLFACAAAAPTAGNQQLYTILDITHQGLKDQLAESCDHQPFIATAPVVLIFCADFQKWYAGFEKFGCQPRKPAVGDLILAVDDALIAAQNVVTAAESLGLRSCYIGDIMEQYETHKALLRLPRYVFPAAMLVIGYPTENQVFQRKPKRQPISMVVRENYYQPMTDEELARLLTLEPGQSREERFGTFCQRKYNSSFSREMSRSVARYIEEFQ